VPLLESTRLRLRAPLRTDFPNVARLWGDPEVARFTIGRPATAEESWTRLLRNTGHWALLGYGLWMVEERDSGAFVGEVGVLNLEREITPSLEGMPEMGWVLLPQAHGRGFGTEAVRMALAWVDANLDCPRSVCIIAAENAASVRLADKCGFRHLSTGRYRGAPIEIYARPRGLLLSRS
jgi:RimJ/RimL family protein N-acetyltransferase